MVHSFCHSVSVRLDTLSPVACYKHLVDGVLSRSFVYSKCLRFHRQLADSG